MRRNTFIIAEAGVNHNGDLSIARKLIDVAAEAGVDVVKFQTFRTENLVTQYANKADYQLNNSSENEYQYQMLKRLELTREMHIELIEYCRLKGIEFFSTAFDKDSIDLLVELGINYFKIPSGEITNLPYIRYLGSLGKRIILSTGMSEMAEIEAAVQALETSGTLRSNITILHCNTEYPTPMEDVNLKAMVSLRDTFGVEVGYSDHTQGIEVSVAAVALGGTVIEKHFTLNKNMPGPDHKASLEPHELKQFVSAIRNIEKAMGDGIKKPSPSERKNKAIVRKSIVAARAIKEGEVFTEENLAVKRPANGLSPMLWDKVCGRSAFRDFAPDELIEI